jgi:hypothetical protein
MVKLLVPKGVASEDHMRGKSMVKDVEKYLNNVLRGSFGNKYSG